MHLRKLAACTQTFTDPAEGSVCPLHSESTGREMSWQVQGTVLECISNISAAILSSGWGSVAKYNRIALCQPFYFYASRGLPGLLWSILR